MDPHKKTSFRRVFFALLTVTSVVSFTVIGGVAAGADKEPVTRAALGQANPTNAPGQSLYLQKVVIQPGAALAEHHHQGTQVARVLSGVLTYNVVSGAVAIARSDGKNERVAGPATVKLRPGDTVTETADLVHFGSNKGAKPVVILLAALLETGAPLATTTTPATTPGGPPVTSLRLTTTLASQARTLHTVSAGDVGVYGSNLLTGTATLDGQTVTMEMQAIVDYTSGNGPFSGVVTFSFADGSTLGVAMQGSTTAAADGTSANFTSTLGAIGGTGKYLKVTGTGIFTGSRTAALGTNVAATFDLQLVVG